MFVLHSGGRTGASTRDYFAFEKFAADKAVFVYPDGEGGNWDLDTPAALQLENEGAAEVFLSGEFMEGIGAFFERRPAKWS